MALVTKYITLDDVTQYFPDLNLRIELGTEDNALAFLKRIEDRLATYLDANFNRNIEREYPTFTDYQKEHYKLALLEQVVYIFRNSDISTDSGYDTERGEIVDRNKLIKLAIAPNCKDNLILCGLWTRVLRSTRRVGDGLEWWFGR